MKKALVVDDSRAMRMMLSSMLREIGFDVAQAEHGQAGLTHLTSHPDTMVALVDWNMPEMTGIEMVEAVRRDGSLRSVKLMMVTTESEMSQMQRALGAGADEYVMKPFDSAILESKFAMAGLLQ